MYAERGAAVHDGYADLDLDDLAIKVSRQKALAQQLNTTHLALEAAWAQFSQSSRPEYLDVRKALFRARAPGRVRLPWFCVLTGWDDSGSVSIRTGIMALARIIRTVCDDAADLMFGQDLIEQSRRHGASRMPPLVNSTARS